MPSSRHMISELLLLRSSQLILDDQECQARIGRLTETVKREDAEDLRRYNAHMREESEPSTGFGPIPEDPSDHELSVGWEPTPWQGWRKWHDEGAPGPQHCVDLFRLVLVGDFPYPHYDVRRWIWFILDREVCMRRADPISGLHPGICSFKELHIYLRRDHRPGMCMWRELAIRRLRFDYCPFPFDFEEVFREAQDNELGPDTFILGLFGADATWETMATGVRNPTSDDAENLDWEDPEGELAPGVEPTRTLLPTTVFPLREDGIAAEDGDLDTDAIMAGEQDFEHFLKYESSDDMVSNPGDQNFRCGGLKEDLKIKFQRVRSQR